ncbi:MAG TPA: hypothetical protein PKD24_01345 [Pyrinomonadaceae bacterium]|nr:hypothetical protein [Pyrinomonadaceae bacterium]
MNVRSSSTTVLFSLVWLFCGITWVAAQGPAGPADKVTDTVKERSSESDKISRLEDQIEAMQRQLDELKAMVRDLTEQKAKDGKDELAGSSQGRSETYVAEKPVPSSVPPLPQEKRELGIDLGHARLTPYGSIYFNAFSNSGGTNNADVPLFATLAGRGGTGASLRQTRLGLRLDRFRIGNANATAVLETDFFGGFPSVGIGENFGVVRLRLANVRLNWERTSLTVGQDWSLFAPSNPTSLAAAAIPQLAASGNNWARLPQVKIEHNLNSSLALQFAVAAQQTGDSATNAPFFLQPNSGSAARIPFLQGRVAYSRPSMLGTGSPGSVALSGHYGRSRVLIGTPAVRHDIDSVGVAADWALPLHKRLRLTGEAFFGRNLAGSQGGIFQGYNTEFALMSGSDLVPGGVRGIATRGGWIQVGFTPAVLRDRFSLYSSIGIDDPRDRDLVTIVPRDLRTRNLTYAFDAIYKVTPQFSIGAEYRRFWSTWTLSGRRTNNHVNLGAVYSF